MTPLELLITIIYSGALLGIPFYFSQKRRRKLEEKLNDSAINYSEEKHKLERNLAIDKAKNEHLTEDVFKVQKELEFLQERLQDTQRELTITANENKNLLKLRDEKLEELNNINTRLTTEFKNIANKILKENSNELNSKNRENLDTILSPFKETIQNFGKKVEETHEKGLKEQINLRTEIHKLHDLNLRVSEEANNLTRALTSDNKQQGNWGELVLEKVLERSGLQKGIEFQTQASYRNDSGDLLRPDVVVMLPDEKNLIIDAKVSLTAYEQFINSSDDSEREKLLKLHIDSVKHHIKSLSEKSYPSIPNLETPDFTLLFMPLESAFSLALQNDESLFGFAWEKRIVIVSPTTLLATLQTVASIWKYDKQNKNVIEIAERGGLMIDKFYSVLEDLTKLGVQLNTVNNTYEAALKKIKEGRGNLISQTEKLVELGAKAKKDVPTIMK